MLFIDRMEFDGFRILFQMVLTEPDVATAPSTKNAAEWKLDTGFSGEAIAWRTHLAEAGLVKPFLVARTTLLRSFQLGVTGRVDCAAVLAANVVTLSHVLSRVVVLPEDLEQGLQIDLLGMKHYEYRFSVAGPGRAGLFIRRVGRGSTAVSGRGRENTWDLPEQPLGAPEATHSESDRFHV